MIIESFLGTDQWSDGRILRLLSSATSIKVHEGRSGAGSVMSAALQQRILGMVFFNPSLRTRTSFEVAMLRHGGHAVTLEPGKGVWGFETQPGVVMDGAAAEHIVEAARVLGRYVDVLGVRAFPTGGSWEEARIDRVIDGFADHAGVPVINFESARRHPCQGLADALTIQENFGSELTGRKFVLSWAWHPNPLPTAVPVSAAINAARLGMDVIVARPEGYELDPEDMKAIRETAFRSGGSISETDRLEDAASDADVVYAKSWGRLDLFGDPELEREQRETLRQWQVDAKLMSSTRRGGGIFMHCLPVRRNVVVSDDVLDGPWSVVVDQAENRLHVQRALLLELLGRS